MQDQSEAPSATRLAAKPATSVDPWDALDIRTGQVVRAESPEDARKPAIELWIDLDAELGVRRSSAQLTRRDSPEGSVEMPVPAVANFPAWRASDARSWRREW